MPHNPVIPLLYIQILILPSAHISSLNLKEEVPYAYTRRAAKVILLYILSLRFLYKERKTAALDLNNSRHFSI
jgi:hypothetical protein